MLKRNLKANICRLCLNTKCDVDFEVVEVIKEILEIAWPKLNLEEGDKHFICSSCSEKLFAAFNFKSICTDTEDTIFPYVNSQEMSLVDLREIYLKEKGDIQLIDILKYQKICRLCFQLVRCGFISLNEVDADIIDNYIPEVNFNATKDPVICTVCFKSLVTHGTFLSSCFAALEENRKAAEDREYCIKHEEIEIGDEESDPPPRLENEKTIKNFKARCNSKEKIKKDPPREVPTYTCNICNFKTMYKSSLKRHGLTHVCPTPTYISKSRDASLPCPLRDHARIFQCDKCPYKVRRKQAFVNHWLTHEVPPKVKMYQCEICHYRVTREDHFRRHQLRHEESAETIENFESRRKSKNIPVKNKKHPPKKVPTYPCNRCNFKTAYKKNLKRHWLKHVFPTPTCTSPKSQCESESRDASSPCPLRDRGQMYQCERCPYRASLRQAIINHWWTHEMPAEVKVYQCEKCFHRVTRVDHFRLHQLRHGDSTVRNEKHPPGKEPTYMCNRCDFKTTYKRNLMRHCSSHISPTPTYITLKSQCKGESRGPLSPFPLRRQERMYLCEKCPYRVHDKKTFITHWWTHEMPFEEKVYECEKCHYRVTREDHFRRHQLRHEDGGRGEKYTCDKCGFKTRYKMCLFRHQLRHDTEQWRDIKCYTSDGELTYKCNVCKYETKDKRQILFHQSNHAHSSRQPTFNCRRCPYKSDNKDKLTRHQSKHNSRRKPFKCDLCFYQTIWKNNLIRHQLCHKKKCEVEMYECFKCNFKTKYKDNLKKHIVSLCKDVCNKETTVQQLGGAK